MECQKMNITPKVILSNFRSFPISPVRESRFSLFFVHRTPTKASFSRFPFIVPRIWTIFPENWWFTLVSGQFFSKTDDLLPYLDWFSWKSTIYYRIWADFPENWWFTLVSEWISRKAKKRPSLYSETSFEMVFSYWFVSDKIFKKAFVFWHCLRFYFASQSISVVALTRLNVSGVICR